MAKKYYAVRKGRKTGVFATWAECQKQVTGFSGAEFKSFGTMEEAKALLEKVLFFRFARLGVGKLLRFDLELGGKLGNDAV